MSSSEVDALYQQVMDIAAVQGDQGTLSYFLDTARKDGNVEFLRLLCQGWVEEAGLHRSVVIMHSILESYGCDNPIALITRTSAAGFEDIRDLVLYHYRGRNDVDYGDILIAVASSEEVQSAQGAALILSVIQDRKPRGGNELQDLLSEVKSNATSLSSGVL